jgi:uncharacterized protein (DUF433 family)
MRRYGLANQSLLAPRVPVDLILGKLTGGMTYEEVMAEYEITREDILAVLDYAAKILSSEEVRAVS